MFQSATHLYLDILSYCCLYIITGKQILQGFASHLIVKCQMSSELTAVKCQQYPPTSLLTTFKTLTRSSL